MKAGQEGTSAPRGRRGRPGWRPPYRPAGPRRRPSGRRTALTVALPTTAVVAAAGTMAAIAAGREDGHRHAPRHAAAAPARLDVPAPVGPAAASTPPGAMRSITTPDSVAGYRRQSGEVADRMADNLRKSMEAAQGPHGSAYGKAKIAIYQRPGERSRPLIFVGLPGKDIPQLAAELRSRPSSDEVDSVFVGMGIMNAKDYPAGPLGGVLRCGQGSTGGTATAAACVWADRSVVGLTMTPLSSDVAGLARVTLALRNAAER